MDLSERIAAKRLSHARRTLQAKLPRSSPNPLPIDGRFAFSSFESEVHHWGSKDPWGARVRLPPIKHKIKISDVITDKSGNVLVMPALIGRPCFGRIETFLRQAKPAEDKKIVRGNREVATRTKCMGCGVRLACKALVAERIKSSPTITDAVLAWHRDSIKHHGKRVYTGPTGRLWTKVLFAVVGNGRFDSSNDDVVREAMDTAYDRLKEKWRLDKRRQRKSDINAGLMDHFTLECVVEERDNRFRTLLDFCKSPAAPPDMQRWNAATCSLVADAWLAITSLKAERRKSGSTAAARWLIANDRSNGRGERALITRVGQDMKKLHRVETLRVWGSFDPLGARYDAELNRMVGELQRDDSTPFELA